jgi:hypothetical protein
LRKSSETQFIFLFYKKPLDTLTLFFSTFLTLKEIVSWDFDGVFRILSYSLDVGHVPLHVLLF